MIGRWTYCYTRAGDEYEKFVRDYFGRREAAVLLICGSGFDPRARVIPNLVSAAGSAITAWLIREERADPARRLRDAADATMAELQRTFPSHRIIQFDVFASDGAVVAGPNLMKQIGKDDLSGFTDVLVDVSSLSVGVAFPLVKWLHELTVARCLANLHLGVTSDPELDEAIQFTASDKVQPPKGFAYGSHARSPEAKMWIPQLQLGQNQSLEKIRQVIAPQDVCPLLPFPTRKLRTPEDLIVAYGDLLNAWDVDPSSVIFAIENRPLDIYRTIVRLKTERDEVFRALGPSEIIITPMGSKVIAAGALMAALELDLTVQYVEAESFSFPSLDDERARGIPIGVWLHGGPTWYPTK